jgi:quercetin dioxygenase-like cupin family protein
MRRVFEGARWTRPVTWAALGAAVTAILGTSAAWATPPLGFVANQIFASGYIPDGVSEHMQLNKNADDSVTPWQMALQVQGETDAYVQRLVLAPGGYSGWHSHPGLLVGIVKSGTIDFYDANCRKHTVGAGEVYTENADAHGIINTGSADAELYISYLIKHGAPRRLEAPAPACAGETGIP